MYYVLVDVLCLLTLLYGMHILGDIQDYELKNKENGVAQEEWVCIYIYMFYLCCRIADNIL